MWANIIRTQISTHATEFVALIDQTAEAIREHTGRNALCVIDGLDHARVQHSFDLLNDHFTVLTLPKKLSNIFVIPLALLNTSFPATIGRRFSMLPNIKVFKKPKSEELDPEGRNFFDQLMARYVAADLITEAARDSIFRLSAGLVRDKVRKVTHVRPGHRPRNSQSAIASLPRRQGGDELCRTPGRRAWQMADDGATQLA
jgi:hypothetical protein